MGRWLDITYIRWFTDLKCTARWIFTCVIYVYTCENPTQINMESISSTPKSLLKNSPRKYSSPSRGYCYVLFCLFLTFTEMESYHKHSFMSSFRGSCLLPYAAIHFFPTALQHVFNSFIHSPIDGHLGYFQFGAIMKKTMMSTFVYVF